MKILVLGGVAAGTKAAAKMKREDRSADVKIITKGRDISYAGCGLPYYIGGTIHDRADLIVNTPGRYSALTGVDVVTEAEAIAVDFSSKAVVYAKDGHEEREGYDKLIIATGAESIVPPVDGTSLPGVFKVRTPDDAEAIRKAARRSDVHRAVIVGAGFIGLEIAENLMKDGLGVTVIDMAPQIMPNAFDSEMAGWVRRKMEGAGISVLTSARLESIAGEGKAESVRTDKGEIPADIVILALGVNSSRTAASRWRRAPSSWAPT